MTELAAYLRSLLWSTSPKMCLIRTDGNNKYVPEALMHALTELEAAFRALADDQDLQKELDGILKDYVGRESPLYFVERLTEHYKHPNGEGPLIYLKREDLNHPGAHKINNVVAQALLAKQLGKECIIAETGAGQHGVATATVCARFGLKCIIYMGAQDMERRSLNVFRMWLLGAEENLLLFYSLDYPGVGPEHSFLKDLGCAEYHSITDEEALEAVVALEEVELQA